MTNLDAVGISSYHKNLPKGKSDIFIRKAADAIGKSTPTVYYKLKNKTWSKLELIAMQNVIEEFERM